MSEHPKVYGFGAFLADASEQAQLRNVPLTEYLRQVRDEDDARDAAREAEQTAAEQAAAESNVIQFRPRA